MRYGVAVCSVALAGTLTRVLQIKFDSGIFPLFLAAVTLSAWCGGTGPGLLATLLSSIVIEYFFLPPAHPFGFYPDYIERLCVFLAAALLISRLNTSRKRSEAALRATEKLCRAQYEASPIPTFSWRKKGEDFVLVDFNPAAGEFTHGRAVNIMGMTIRELYPDMPQLERDFEHCLAGRKVFKREDEFRLRTTGEVKQLTVTFAPVSRDLIMVHLEDTTERKRADAARGRLRQRLLGVEEEERRRIARELHDQLGGDLTALTFVLKAVEMSVEPNSQALEQLARAHKLIDHLDTEARYLIWELRPPALDRSPLDVALDEYVEEWSKRHRMPAAFDGDGFDGRRLPKVVETTLYRVAQEALTNVRKHANARRVRVVLILEHETDRVCVVVSDDGIGFDPRCEEAGISARRNLGIEGMRERLELLQGGLEIQSGPGRGTTVSAVIPLQGAWREGEDSE